MLTHKTISRSRRKGNTYFHSHNFFSKKIKKNTSSLSFKDIKQKNGNFIQRKVPKSLFVFF